MSSMTRDSYIYRDTPGTEGAPMIVALHGTGGDENQLFDLARHLTPDATVLAPRGDVSEHGAARFFRRQTEGIYDMDDLAMRSQALAGFIRAHRDRVKPSRLIGLGYSNGANILATITVDDPSLFNDVMLLHPLIPWRPADEAGLKGRRVLITAGRRDPICPPSMTRQLASYFVDQGVDLSLVWHEGGHELAGPETLAMQRFLRSAPLDRR